MKIIGIVTRNDISNENNKINIMYDDIINAIEMCEAIPIGIVLTCNYKTIIDMCDGIIFQGGDYISEYEKEAINYAYMIDKPTLCICLGMQLMGYINGGNLIDIKNHKSKLKYVHSININPMSKLYKIYKTNILKVNSRHKSILTKTNYLISAKSNDGYIEAIEDPNKKFFIGVQWHPESMIYYDKKQLQLFKYFIKVCTNK